MLTTDDVFDGVEVRQSYIAQVKPILERENLRFEWQHFVEYEADREGIRYHFEDGYADWIMPGQIDNQHLYVFDASMRNQVLEWHNVRFIG
jgi:hypothetical protein